MTRSSTKLPTEGVCVVCRRTGRYGKPRLQLCRSCAAERDGRGSAAVHSTPKTVHEFLPSANGLELATLADKEGTERERARRCLIWQNMIQSTGAIHWAALASWRYQPSDAEVDAEIQMSSASYRNKYANYEHKRKEQRQLEATLTEELEESE